ncbi:MAG: hypothetical protein DWQ04_09420 [Chloroflexi bacterium]|nr:MAG: hypothetical protein DWQ04_09420 [Chloroflexota bacterium]
MLYTVEISEELASQLNNIKSSLPRILELGLREHNASKRKGFSGTAEVLEFLATLPSPEEILTLKPSKPVQERISTLLQKGKTNSLTPEEEEEWEQYQYLEHLVRMAKIAARHKLQHAGAGE